jgi:DNA-binding NarL/FixJ family response regulator
MTDDNQNSIVSILVAESHELIRMGLRLLFENCPSVQILAESDCFDDLFPLAVKHQPDVILLDLLLNDGQCIEQIPQLIQACPQSKILAFSSDNDEQTHFEALGSGAMGIFAKHHSTELLIKAIHTVNEGQVWFNGHQQAALANASYSANTTDNKRTSSVPELS